MLHNRFRLWPISLFALILAILACSIQGTKVAPILTPTIMSTSMPTATPEVRRYPLPYSFEENGLKITILEVVPATKEHGILVPEGYRQWTINFQYENLLNIDWEHPQGDCAGLDSFRLETDQGNIYKPRFVGGSPFCFDLKPKAVSIQKELYIFEIREDETPIALWGYDKIGWSEEQLLYIFTLGR